MGQVAKDGGIEIPYTFQTPPKDYFVSAGVFLLCYTTNIMWEEKNDILIKDFKFSGFNQAVDFVNKIKDAANTANHHPDLLIHGYSNVEVRLTTHSENGKVTEKDHALSKTIDNIYSEMTS